MKLKKILLVLLLASACVGKTYTIAQNGTSTNISDSIAAANSNSGQDTICLPAFDLMVKDSLTTITDPLVIVGAGPTSTILRDSTPNAYNQPVFRFGAGLDSAELVCIKNIGFRGPLGSSEGIILAQGTASHYQIIENCIFDSIPGRVLRVLGRNYGVIRNCFIGGNANNFILVEEGSTWDDSSWSWASNFGSTKFWFVEDCRFSKRTTAGNTIDANAGGRFVFRYNYATGGGSGNIGFGHGPCYQSGVAGTRAWEIYKNRLQVVGTNYSGTTMRSGTGLIFGNSYSGAITGNCIHLDIERTCNDIADGGTHDGCVSSGWGRCDGGDPVDGNSDATGWPCYSQPGRGQDFGLEPVYAWGNDSAGSPCGIRVDPAWTCTSPALSDHLKENRDFYNDSIPPTYTAQPWPHPLARITPACSTASTSIDTVLIGATVRLFAFAVTDSAGMDSTGFYNRAGRNLVARVNNGSGYDTLTIDTIYPHNGHGLQDSMVVNISAFNGTNGKYPIQIINGDGLSTFTKDSVYIKRYKHLSSTHKILDTLQGIIEITTWKSKVYMDTSSNQSTWGVLDSMSGTTGTIDTIAPISGKYHRTRGKTIK